MKIVFPGRIIVHPATREELGRIADICDKEGLDYPRFEREYTMHPSQRTGYYRKIMKLAYPMRLGYVNPKIKATRGKALINKTSLKITGGKQCKSPE